MRFHLRCRFGSRPALLAALLAAVGPAAAQSPVPVDPHRALTTTPDGGPASLVVNDTPADRGSAPIAALGDSPIAAVLRELTPEARALHEHITTLANPFFEGRVPGSRGNRLAADYIQWAFERAGLQPAFTLPADTAAGRPEPTKSFRQAFRAGTDTKITTQAVTFSAYGEVGAFEQGKDFVTLGLSGTGKVSGPVTVVGYAIDKGQGGYTSFAENTDLTGQIALVFRFEPMDERGRSQWTQGNGWSPAASLDDKIKALADRKAAGVVLVNPPGADDPRARTLMDTRATLALSGRDAGVPVVMLAEPAAEKLLSLVRGVVPPPTLKTLREDADKPGPHAVRPLAGTLELTLDVAIAREPIMTDNVGAVLPGKGNLAGEWVVIGAHHDHVGLGPTGARPENVGKLHPGADDNASGTSGVLVLADALAKEYAKLPAGQPARSVLFLTFCAEESGLNGSRYFANNPSIPLDKTALMINLDMIGRLRTGTLEIQGTQSAKGLYDAIKPAIDASGLDPKHGSTVASNSDHASFYNKEVPVLFFFTGLHREYHTPQDTSDLINAPGAARVVSLVKDVALLAATRPQRFAFDKDARSRQPASPGPMRTRVRFGIAPGTYSDDKPGIEIGDVYPNTPAAAAGLKTGDRMIKWNGAELRKVEDWMPLLSKANAGDVVTVTILRDGKEQDVQVTLTARDERGR